MRWLTLGLFLAGLAIVLLGVWGARQDAKNGQSADVAMGNDFIKAIGFALWGLDALIVIIWRLVS